MAVMTLYNPVFLISDLRRIGLDVQFKKSGGIHVSKKYGGSHLKFVGIGYLYEMIQTHLVGEDTVVALLQKSIETVEKAGLKQTTRVNLDSISYFNRLSGNSTAILIRPPSPDSKDVPFAEP